MAVIRVVTTRAPGMIPDLVRRIGSGENPVVLIPESFTLACETEIVRNSSHQGIFDLKIFSPSSLVREIRELTGIGDRKPVSADGQNMVFSRLLHHHQDELKYYRDAVAQPALAQKFAGEINDLERAHLTPDFLEHYCPAGRRTRAKADDVALLWKEYRLTLGNRYEDMAGQWQSALSHIGRSGLLRNARLLIYGFDYITHDLTDLILEAARPENYAAEIVIGVVCDDEGPDKAVFRAASDSIQRLEEMIRTHGITEYERIHEKKHPALDPGIAYVEKTINTHSVFAKEKTVLLPDADLSRVRAYYAKNSYLECQHACQTLIEWHRNGIRWEDMAVAVCEQNTLPSLLPLTLTAAGIPFNAKQDQPILLSGYAQYLMSLLRIMRMNFCQNDVLRLIRTGFSPLSVSEGMEMENYARAHGIHRNRWLLPFYLPENRAEREKAEQMEKLRRLLVEPVVELRKALSGKECSGIRAASLLFQFITEAGIYEKLLEREEILAKRGDDREIDRNRQVWNAVNETLDSVASFIGEEALPLHDLCSMLEASLTARQIKSLPQISNAVTVAPPQMFFSSGVKCMLVMGLQENELSSGGGVFSENERAGLEKYIKEENRKYYKWKVYGLPEDAAVPEGAESRPFAKIGQSMAEMAARQKQDVYQAVSLAREQLMVSCSGARPSGGILTPSSAFSNLYRVIREKNPENVSGGLMTNTDIRPFAPVFALETLAVKLRDMQDDADHFLNGSGMEDNMWRNALGFLYQSESWHERTAGVLRGLKVTLPSRGLSPEQAEKLYQGRAMSISRVETFSSCPWRHLLEYGLDLFTDESFAYERNEQGTFNHEVLRGFLEKAMKLPEWPNLSDVQYKTLLNHVIREQTDKWEGGILRSDILHRYQGFGIIHSIRTSIDTMMRAFRQTPHFLPVAAEVPFGMPDDRSEVCLPAVQIRTEDGGTVSFSGKIDRIDRLDLPDGKSYFMIIDNKLSSREVKQNSLVMGLQLQLPLYIRAARQGMPGLEPAGGLYQPVRDILADGEDPDRTRARIDHELQPSGMIVADPQVQAGMKPVKIARNTENNDVICVVSPEEMRQVEECALRVIQSGVTRIRAGVTAPDPLQDGQQAPCEWCAHRDACLHDSTLPGCRIRVLDHKHRMDLILPEH